MKVEMERKEENREVENFEGMKYEKNKEFLSTQYQQLRKKAIRTICENDSFAMAILKDGILGKSSRFLNLLTDVYVNTANPKLSDPDQFAKEFKIFSFLAFDPAAALKNKDYELYIQNILVNELFVEPGQFSSLKSKFEFASTQK